jgi:hypothetical protein
MGPDSGTRPTEVQRLVHGGQEATSRQMEPGEKTQMSPSGPRLTYSGSNSGHLDLIVQSGPRAMPTESPSRRGQRATLVSRTTRASTGSQVTEQWNATCRLCQPRHERRTRIPLGRPKLSLGTPVRSSPSPSLEPLRQVMPAQPLQSLRRWTGSPLRVHAYDAPTRSPSFMTKAVASRDTVFLLIKNDKLLAPN